MRRKILMGVLALALSAGTVAFTQAAAFARTSANPVTCSLSATVTFSTPLSVAGVLESSPGDTSTTTVNETLSSCSTASGPVGGFSQSFNLVTPAATPRRDPAALAAGDSRFGRYLGLCGLFNSRTTTTSIRRALNRLPVGGGILHNPKAIFGAVGPDTGFIIYARVRGGTYPTINEGATMMVGFTNDANSSNLLGGCNSGPVTHIDIDSSVSTATL